MNLLYRMINPVVKGLLRSPMHGLMSNNTMVLSYGGQRSGKQYELPISYARFDGDLYGFTAKDGQWWRNFRNHGEATVLVGRQNLDVTVSILSELGEDLARRLTGFLQLVPRDAKPAGVRMRQGQPVQEDVAAAVQRLVGLRFTIKQN
jgi:hypothetical protein